jgi:hypothetical protein
LGAFDGGGRGRRLVGASGARASANPAHDRALPLHGLGLHSEGVREAREVVQLTVGALRASALLDRPVGLRLSPDRLRTRLGGGEDRVDAIGHIGGSAHDDGIVLARMRWAGAGLLGRPTGLRRRNRLARRLRGLPR